MSRLFGFALFLVVILKPAEVFAQRYPASFPAIDARARAVKGQDLVQITDTITAGYATDLEKVRAIFSWITGHIAYDCGGRSAHTPEADRAGERLFETHDRIVLILKYRRALCGGYSFLFKTMCDLAGVEARIIEGKAKGSEGHAWNAAKIDGQWYWFDTTWASGGCDGPRFKTWVREEFFLAPPAELRYSHIPSANFWDTETGEPR